MDDDSEITADTPAPRRHRGPEGIGDQAARALGESVAAGESIGGVEEEAFLKQWFPGHGRLFPEDDWESFPVLSQSTSEHEVRYRKEGHRVIKRTWPGTFGNVPHLKDGQWMPAPATPSEYLLRMALQNEVFGDDIRVEGAMIDSGPSMIIGQPSGGLSLVISQRYLDAADDLAPHPTEFEIADFLQDRGFAPIHSSFYGWRHDAESLIVLDAKPDNFIHTLDGILPIDLLLTQQFHNN